MIRFEHDNGIIISVVLFFFSFSRITLQKKTDDNN